MITKHTADPDCEHQIDMVRQHTDVLMTLGLVKATHDRAIREANRDLLMILYKYMLIWFKTNEMSNYSTGLLELQFQMRVLPAYLAHAVKWNRFVNTRGKADSNIPMGKGCMTVSYAKFNKLKLSKTVTIII